MKGMVFTEFLDMVEDVWSLDMVDTILDSAHPPSGGAYTSVGTYPHEELLALVSALSSATKQPTGDLVRGFGRHLFGRFSVQYGQFFHGIRDSFHFLAGIEEIIHAEVRKLYPDAELPGFEVESDGDTMTLTYFSSHPFADLAHGLIEGCVAHFGDRVDIRREAATERGAQARFVLLRQI